MQREQEERSRDAAGGSGSEGPKVTPLMEYLKAKYQSDPGMRLGAGRRRAKAGTAPLPVAPNVRGGGGGGWWWQGGGAVHCCQLVPLLLRAPPRATTSARPCTARG